MADHWVPLCYLRNFTIIEGEEQVYMYVRGGHQIPTNIKNVAAENDRYTFIDKETGEKLRDAEEMFTKLEDSTAPVLKKIAKQKTLANLNGSEYGALVQFVAFLATRGPTYENISKNHYTEAFKLFMEAEAHNPQKLRENFKEAGVEFESEEEFENARKDLLNLDGLQVEGGKGYFFKQALEIAMLITDILLKEKAPFLLVAKDKRVFVTSDNPVILQTPLGIPWWLAGGYKYGTVLLPITPEVCLGFRSMPLKNEIVKVGEKDIEYINKSILKSAKRQVYSNLSSKSIKGRFDLTTAGEDSKVTTTKMKHTPYVFTQGPENDKELPLLDRHTMSMVEIKSLLSNNNE